MFHLKKTTSIYNIKMFKIHITTILKRNNVKMNTILLPIHLQIHWQGGFID